MIFVVVNPYHPDCDACEFFGTHSFVSGKYCKLGFRPDFPNDCPKDTSSYLEKLSFVDSPNVHFIQLSLWG